MTLTITISPEKEAAYQQIAQAQGLSVEQWLTQLVDQAGARCAVRDTDTGG